MYNTDLNPTEKAKLNKWLEKPAIARAVYGGELALVFSWNSGIGRAASATVKNKDGVIFQHELTDYTCW